MAKYNVMFSCGHEETIQLYGPGKERERKIDYYKNYGLCRNCYKAQRDAEFAKKSEEATEMFGTLPELEGTAKQIAWATSLRQKFANFVYDFIKSHDGLDGKDFMHWMFGTHTEAKFWIDNRYDMESLSFLERNAKKYIEANPS